MTAPETPEQALARARSIAFETEYWLRLVEDMQAMLADFEAVTNELASATVAILTVTTAPADRRSEFALDALTSIREAMGRLLGMQRRVGGVAELVGGRHAALTRELAGGHSMRLDP